MKFLGYISKTLLETTSEENILFHTQGCIVFKEVDGIKLAIELPPNNHICALFLWNEFYQLSDSEKQLTIQQQKADFINIYKETWGLLSVIEPNTILEEAREISQFNSSDREYLDDDSTIVIASNGNVRLETDANNSVWFVLVGTYCISYSNENEDADPAAIVRKTYCYSISNEEAAIQLFRMISKDIENFIRVRWSV